MSQKIECVKCGKLLAEISTKGRAKRQMVSYAQSLRFEMSGEGKEAAWSVSVATALARADKEPFDLVISDIGLADGDGCDLMVKLRERHGLKGIAMTGYGMEDDITRTQKSGYVAHLTKPISIQSLESAIALIVLPKK